MRDGCELDNAKTKRVHTRSSVVVKEIGLHSDSVKNEIAKALDRPFLILAGVCVVRKLIEQVSQSVNAFLDRKPHLGIVIIQVQTVNDRIQFFSMP